MKTVGILKETINGENRVILLPEDIKEIATQYKVLVETDAGVSLGYQNFEYERYGAEIVSKEECWEADFILKYKYPTKDEYQYLNENTKIGAIFHAEGDFELLKELKAKQVTAYTYEFIETDDNFFPMAYPGGEIAGKMAVMYAMFYKQKQLGGNGKSLFAIRGSKRGKVAVIGYGNLGGAAIKLAAQLGNEVHVFASNLNKLKKTSVYLDENIKCYESIEENLKKVLPEMDAIIGAILISTYDTKPIITEEMFNMLKPGTVVIDGTCGYGKGYLPSIDKYTSLKEPVYISDNGVVCCKIDNLPSAYPISTCEAYSKNGKEWLLRILNNEFSDEKDVEVERGKIFDKGNIVHEVIKQHWEFYTNE